LPHQDTPFFGRLHIILASLVLLQIFNSNMTEREALGQFSLAGILSFMHIISGFGLLLCGVIMLVWRLTQRGVGYYFSYLYLNFQGAIDDVRTLSQFHQPEAHA